MESTHTVQILLASYNGEKFLHEQLDSLLGQSFQDFEILVRDDGSTDGTLDVLKEYQERFPEKIRLLSSTGRLGVVGNFSALLEAAAADYLLFSDQDDIWLKDKVKLTYEALIKGEAAYGKSTPLLVHTDLTVVDSNKNIISPSFWQFSTLDPVKGQALNRLLVQNVVTGCATGINRALALKSAPIPPEAIMHDWWLALVAALTGHVLPLHESTILYRQHANNTLGVKPPSLKRKLIKAFRFLFIPSAFLPEIERLERQAKSLFERYRESCSKEAHKVLSNYIKSPQMSKLKRKWTFLKYRYFRSGFARNAAYLFQDRPF